MRNRLFTTGPVALAGIALLGISALAPPAADAATRSAAKSRSSQVSGRTPGSVSHGGRAVVTRTHRGRSYVGVRHGHRGHHGHYGRFYGPSLGLTFGLGYWGGYFYSPYYPYRYGYYPYAPRYGYGSGYPVRLYSAPVGAFDLNVKPKKAQVWVDGRYVGTAGKFDGYPDYLWLAEGEHQLVFYLEGYGTVERRVETLAGVVADLRIDMERGESIPPREIAVEPPPSGTSSDSRRPDDYAYRSTLPPSGRAAPPAESGDAVLDARTAPGRLVVQVEPRDASVYLDGRFLGTGHELSRLHAGLLVDSGEHVLEVVRPGYEAKVVKVSVAAGEERLVEVGLQGG